MRTVNLDDDTSRMLKNRKAHRGESFSHLVRRLLRPEPAVDDTAGAWKHMPEAEAKRRRQASVDTFGYVGGPRGRRRQ